MSIIRKTGTNGPTVWRYRLYSLGLLSKPSILTFPVLLLILDYWPLQRLTRPPSPDSAKIALSQLVKTLVSFLKSLNGSIVIEKIPFFILSLLSYFLSMISISQFHIVINYSLIPLDLRIYNLFVSDQPISMEHGMAR